MGDNEDVKGVPKISVVICFYNMEQYAERTISSVIKQDYDNLEIVLVDDGSSDGTPIICDQYIDKDYRIKVIHKKNEGPSAARNAALDIITGDYVGFIDGDDVILPNMYSTLVNNMRNNSFDISEITYFRFVQEDRPWHVRKGENIIIDSEEDILCDYLRGLHYSGSLNFRITKREIIGEMRLDTKLRNNEDALFSYYCLKNAKTACYQDISLYGYRYRKGSLSQPLEEPISTIGVARKIYEDAIEFGSNLMECANTYLYNALISEIRGICGNLRNIRKYRRQLEKLKKEVQIISANNIVMTRNKKIERFIIKHCLPLEHFVLRITGR